MSPPFNQADEVAALALDSARNVVVTGRSVLHTAIECYTAKYSGIDGHLLWEHRFGRGERRASGSALNVDSLGDVTITGIVERGGGCRVYTARYRGTDGSLLWEYIMEWEGIGNDEPSGMTIDPDGNVIVVGHTSADGGKSFVVKLSLRSGTPIWRNFVEGAWRPHGLVSDKQGNVLVLRQSNLGEANTSHYHLALTKYAARDGAVLWEERSVPEPGSVPDGMALASSADGGVVMITSGKDPRRSVGLTKRDASDGRILWNREYAVPRNDANFLHGVAVDKSNDVIAWGESTSLTHLRHDCYLAKFSGSNGDLIWGSVPRLDRNTRYVSSGLVALMTGIAATFFWMIKDPRNHRRAAVSVMGIIPIALAGVGFAFEGSSRSFQVYRPKAAIDPEGNISFVAQTNNLSGYHVGKVSGVNGRVLWDRWEVNGSAGDTACEIAVDSTSTPVVGGFCNRYELNTNIYLAKLHQGNGVEQWVIRDDAGQREAEVDAFWNEGTNVDRSSLYEMIRGRPIATENPTRTIDLASAKWRSVRELSKVAFRVGATEMSRQAEQEMLNTLSSPLMQQILQDGVQLVIVGFGDPGQSGSEWERTAQKRADKVAAVMQRAREGRSIISIGTGDVAKHRNAAAESPSSECRVFALLPRFSSR